MFPRDVWDIGDHATDGRTIVGITAAGASSNIWPGRRVVNPGEAVALVAARMPFRHNAEDEFDPSGVYSGDTAPARQGAEIVPINIDEG